MGRMWSRAVALGVGLGVLGSWAGASAATTYTVSGTSDAAGSCNLSHVCTSLRAAVNAANADPGSTVQLGATSYTLTIGPLTPTADMNIAGAGSGATTIQQTSGHDGVIFINGGTLNLSGLTVTGGDVTGGAGASGTTGGVGTTVGGAGLFINTTAVLQDVTVTGNTITGGAGGDGTTGNGGSGGGGDGAGIYNAGTLTLRSSTVTGNHAFGGPGGNSSSGGGGTAGPATGGIDSVGGAMLLQNSSVTANDETGGAGGSGAGAGKFGGFGGNATGAIDYEGSAAVTIQGSTVSGNTSTAGAGGAGNGGATGGFGGPVFGGGLEVIVTSSPVQLTGSTLSGNAAHGGAGGPASGGGTGGAGGQAFGGGLYHQVPVTVVNSTVTGNSASGGSAGSPGGSAGQGIGGGIQDNNGDLAVHSLKLFSVTLASNSADHQAGNLYSNGTVAEIQNTIVASGTAPLGSNCFVDPTTMDDGHNLESTTPTQCQFTQPSDKVGANPVLESLAANGGPSKTMALGAGSPALSAGGQCTDPLNSNNPLTVDQRGLPRPNPCDIGAFQAQRPVATSAPQVTGSAIVGQPLSCSQGTWTGDPPLNFSYQWLRDGTPLPGATSPGYTVQPADVGHQLACQVTASNIYGQTSQLSNSVNVPSPATGGSATGGFASGGGGTSPPPTPALSSARLSASTFRAADHGGSLTRKRRPPVGTTVIYRDSQAATTTFAVLAPVVGHRAGRRCLAGRPRRGQRRCSRYATIGSFTHADRAGNLRVRFSGRVRGRKLKPGRYLLTLTPRANGKAGRTVKLTFRIVT